MFYIDPKVLLDAKTPESVLGALFPLLLRAGAEAQCEYAIFSLLGEFEVFKHNFPGRWCIERNKLGIALDPALSLITDRSRPFCWYDVPKPENSLFAVARRYGLKSGFTIPFTVANDVVGVLSLVSSQDLKFCTQVKEHLLLSGRVFYFTLSAILDLGPEPPISPLTDREANILAWVGRGKCTWEIGQILNITENTVKFHLKNAMRKLEAPTRALAVIKAIQFKYIELNAA